MIPSTLRPYLGWAATLATGLLLSTGYDKARDAMKQKTEYHDCVLKAHTWAKDDVSGVNEVGTCKDGTVTLGINVEAQEASGWNQSR